MQGDKAPETGIEPANEGVQVAGALGSITVSEVEKQLDEALAKANANYDLYLRAKAETDNVRRRAAEDVARAHKFAIESFAESLVPVMDSLDHALANPGAGEQALREGVELIRRQLVAAFERGNLRPIEPLGEKFDPHRHQAISTVPAEGAPANTVVSVLQKGWLISDRVLRPAMVTVAQA
jgi:molecular chaperone GrpE